MIKRYPILLLILAISVTLILAVFTASIALKSQTEKKENQKAQSLPTSFTKTPTTAEEKKEFQSFVSSHAEKSQNITIQKDCGVNPRIVQIVQNSPLTFENADSVVHLIRIDEGSYSIAPGEKKTITIDTSKGLGEYAYRCDGSPTLAGVVQILPK